MFILCRAVGGGRFCRDYVLLNVVSCFLRNLVLCNEQRRGKYYIDKHSLSLHHTSVSRYTPPIFNMPAFENQFASSA